jgi:hypothetical protein
MRSVNVWNMTWPKFSNKAQQFAMAGTHREAEQKKKSFEELVPSYLHDFTNIFVTDMLNKLPPQWPGINHWIETKPSSIPNTSKIYPLSEKEQSVVKAFINENLRKRFIWNQSPLK